MRNTGRTQLLLEGLGDWDLCGSVPFAKAHRNAGNAFSCSFRVAGRSYGEGDADVAFDAVNSLAGLFVGDRGVRPLPSAGGPIPPSGAHTHRSVSRKGISSR
jgi:hypothetical protein